MAADSDVVKLKAEIEAAFADVRYYKEDTLAANKESLAAMNRFEGHSWLYWKGKPLELLLTIGKDLSFYSNWTLRCYLPLYMLAALTDYEQARPLLSEFVELFATRSIPAYTGRQLQSLANFFDFIRQKHGKDLSLYCPLDKAIEIIRDKVDIYSRMNAPGLAATKLKTEIESAFAAVPYPGDADAALVGHFCPECLETAALFRGVKWQDWKDKPLELFSRGREHLLVFTPAAFRYYLPLYMVQILIDYVYADIALDIVISTLIPLSESDEQHQRRYRQMSAREIQAIISFLEFLKKEYGDDPSVAGVDEAIKTARGFIDKH